VCRVLRISSRSGSHKSGPHCMSSFEDSPDILTVPDAS
jgi:hypothetical protein